MNERIMTTTALCMLAAAGCSESNDWDHEVMLQLFKESALAVQSITVRASQAGKDDSVKIEDTDAFFGSCDSNQVRIISQNDDPSTISVTIEGQGFESIEIESLQDTTIIIGEGSGDLIPSCASTPKPDAGVDAALGKTGDPCSDGEQCEGGVCLTELWGGSAEKVDLPSGYCSISCDADPCPTEEQKCYTDRDPNLKEVGKYCFKTCESKANCRSGYKCTTDGICFPE